MLLAEIEVWKESTEIHRKGAQQVPQGQIAQLYSEEVAPKRLLPTALLLGRESQECRSTHPPYRTGRAQDGDGGHDDDKAAAPIYSFSDNYCAPTVFQALPGPML